MSLKKALIVGFVSVGAGKVAGYGVNKLLPAGSSPYVAFGAEAAFTGLAIMVLDKMLKAI